MSTYLVKLWKFDQHHYREKEILVDFNPSYQGNNKPSFWNMVAEIYRNWRRK